MDSFQIALAYSIYSDLWNVGGLTKRDRTPRLIKPRDGSEPYEVPRRSASQQLHALRFSPGMGVGYDCLKAEFGMEFNGEYSDAVEVYLNLIEKHEGAAAAMLEGDELNAEFYVNGSEITLWQATQLTGDGAALRNVLERNKVEGNAAKLSLNKIMGEPHVVLEGCVPLIGMDKIVQIFSVIPKVPLACPKCGGRVFKQDDEVENYFTCLGCDTEAHAEKFDTDDVYEKADNCPIL